MDAYLAYPQPSFQRWQRRALRWETLDEDIWVGDVVAGRFPK